MRALAVTIFADGQKKAILLGHNHGNNQMLNWQTHATHAFRHSTHSPGIRTSKTHSLAFRAEQHNITIIIYNSGTHQMITFNQVNGA